MSGRQHGKSKKRAKNWHRGKGEAQRWARVARWLPDLGTGADPTSGEPKRLPRKHMPKGEVI